MLSSFLNDGFCRLNFRIEIRAGSWILMLIHVKSLLIAMRFEKHTDTEQYHDENAYQVLGS